MLATFPSLSPPNPISAGEDSKMLEKSNYSLGWVFMLLFDVFVWFLVCFFEHEVIAMVAGVNSEEVHDTKYYEMLKNPFHCVITSPLDIS